MLYSMVCLCSIFITHQVSTRLMYQMCSYKFPQMHCGTKRSDGRKDEWELQIKINKLVMIAFLYIRVHLNNILMQVKKCIYAFLLNILRY